MKAPEKIYLQVDGDSIGDSYEDWDGTCTWCQHRINDTDVEYVEASKIKALEQQLAEAEDKLKLIITYSGKVTPERQYLAEVVEYAKMYFRDKHNL